MKTIFWDFDGTLVSSPHMWSNSMLEALKDTVPYSAVTIEDIRRYTPHIFTWNYPMEDHTAYQGENWWEYMNSQFYNTYISLGLSDSEAKIASEKIRPLILRKENYVIFPDAAETLSCLRDKGIRNVILSNNIPELNEIMDEIGLSHYFDGFVISADFGYDKPRRELFEIAKELYPSEKYIMVGDNPKADVKGGKDAGMTTILVHRGEHPDADYCFDTLSEIIGIL